MKVLFVIAWLFGMIEVKADEKDISGYFKWLSIVAWIIFILFY